MSKQGEQVDVLADQVVRGRYDVEYDSAGFVGASVAKRLGREYLALRERVRLLEQREKGLREALEWIIDFALRQRRRALAAECASPPTEESAKPSRPPFDATNRTSY